MAGLTLLSKISSLQRRWLRFMSLSKNFPTNMTRWLANKGHSVGRTETTPHDRAGDLTRCPDPNSRRAHLVGRLGNRGAHHGRPGPLDGRPDHLHYRPSSLDRSASRPDSGYPRRPDY